MNIKEVCRLCLVNNNLLWIFDQRFEYNDHMKDLIFKTIGIQISQEDIISQKICHKCAEDVVKLYKFRKQSIKNDLYLKEQHKKMSQKRMPHRSIIELYDKFPRISLPNICLTEDMSPMVEMEMDEVENYFKKKKINFKRYVQRVIRHSKMQERAASSKSKISTETVSPISIKFREDKSSYEIVHKITEEPKLQSDPVINRKRQLSDSDSCTSKRVRCESDLIQPKPIVLRRQSIGPIDLNSRHVPSLDRSSMEALKITENGNAYPTNTKRKPEIISNILINPLENLIRPIIPSSQLDQLNLGSNDNRLSNEDFHFVESRRNMDIANYLGIVPINKLISEDLHQKTKTFQPQSEIHKKEEISMVPNIISNNPLIDKNQLDFNCKYCKETFSSKDICETHLLNCYKRKPEYVAVENIDHNQNIKQKFNYVKKTNISEVIEICSEDEEEIKPAVLDLHPQIKIKDSRIPIKNYNSSTNDILNNLLVFDKNESPSDKNPQTDLTSENPEINRIISDIKHLPKKDSIFCENNGVIVCIKNLKSYMHIYKVPVYINHGEKLDARYNCEESKKPSKTYKDWNHLTPIDLVINAKENGLIAKVSKSLEITDSIEMDSQEIRQILDAISTIPDPVESSNAPVINVPNATLSKILDTPTSNEKMNAKNSLSINEQIKQLGINNITVSKDSSFFNLPNATLSKNIDTLTSSEKINTNSLSIDEKIKQLEINNINVSQDPSFFNEVDANLPDLAQCFEEIFSSDTNNMELLTPVVNTVISPKPIINNTNDVLINPQVEYLIESSVSTNNNQSNNVSINAHVGYIIDPSRPIVITSTNQLNPNDVSSSIPQVNNLPNIYLCQQNYFSNMLVQHKENSDLNNQVPYSNFNNQINAPVRPINDFRETVYNNYGNMNVYNQPNLNNSHIITNRTWVPPHFNSFQSDNTHPVCKSVRPPPPPYNAYNNTLPSFQKKNHHIRRTHNKNVNCASKQNNIQISPVSGQYTKNCVPDAINNPTVNNMKIGDNGHVIVNQVIQNNGEVSVQYIQNGVPDASNNYIAVNNKESTDNCHVTINQEFPISDTINNASIRVRPLSDLK